MWMDWRQVANNSVELYAAAEVEGVKLPNKTLKLAVLVSVSPVTV